MATRVIGSSYNPEEKNKVLNVSSISIHPKICV